jgi:predicted DNA-binding transcriptional regulator AlpA
MKPKILENIVIREDLAARLGRSPQTLDRWERAGTGPPRIKIGSVVLYRRESIESWLMNREANRKGG